MFEWLERSEGHVLGLRASGKITAEDYQEFTPILDERIASYGRISLLVVLDHIEGVEPGAVWKDVKFDMKHLKHIERFAVVGDAAWEQHLVRAMAPFVHTECKYFDASEIDEAWRWLYAGLSPRDARP